MACLLYTLIVCSGFLLSANCQTAPAPSTAPIAFCAVRSAALPTGATTVAFNTTLVNDGSNSANGPFDITTNTFQVPLNSGGGLFWLHFSVGVPGNTTANVLLMGGSRTPNIFRRHTAFFGADTLSRSELIELNANDGGISISSDDPLYSDNQYQTTFAGFGLTNTMNTVVGFNVGRTTTTTSLGTIRYNVVNVDTHNAFNVTTGQYIVPVTGAYFITVLSATGDDSNSTHYISVFVNSASVTTHYMYDTKHWDVDSLSSSILINLNAGSALYAALGAGPTYSDIRYQTALLGFLYNPTGIVPLSWSVSNEQIYVGTMDPLPFDVVFLNQGQGWDIISNTYSVVGDGVYYIDITAGVVGNYPLKLELVVNGVVRANVVRDSNNHNNIDVKSRAIILRLNQNDVVKLRLPSGYRCFSNSARVTKFTGFRLYL